MGDETMNEAARMIIELGKMYNFTPEEFFECTTGILFSEETALAIRDAVVEVKK